MSFLSNLFGYDRPGPGVRPDEPRKKGAARWFEILGRDLGSFFKAGLLALLGFLPFMLLLSLAIASHAVIFVIAAGVVGGALAMPQIVGMADTLLRSLRDEPGFWWVTYRRAWKRNWKGCLVPGMVCGLVIAGQLFTLFHLRPDNDNLLMLVVMLILGMALSVGLTFYIVPQLALLGAAGPALSADPEKLGAAVPGLPAPHRRGGGRAGGVLGGLPVVLPADHPGLALYQLLAAHEPEPADPVHPAGQELPH